MRSVHFPWSRRLTALATLLLLVAGLLSAVQLERSRRAPSFRRGGEFGGAAAATSPTTVAGGVEAVGPLTFTYHTEYRATLAGFEPA